MTPAPGVPVLVAPCPRCGVPTRRDVELCPSCGLDLVATFAPTAPWIPRDAGPTPAWAQHPDRSPDPPGRLSGRIAMVGLAVAVLTSLLTIALVMPLAEPETWWTGDVDIGAIERVDAVAVAVGLVILAAYLTWSWCVTSAYRGLTGADPTVGRIGSVAWTFVPVANLVMPAVVLWNLLKGLAIPGRARLGWLVPVWWLTYLAANVGTFAWSARITDLSAGPRFQADELARATATLITSEVLSIVAAVALIAAIRRVDTSAGLRARARMQGWPPPSAVR